MKFVVQSICVLTMGAVVLFSSEANAQVVVPAPIVPGGLQHYGNGSIHQVGRSTRSCRQYTDAIRDLRRARRDCVRDKVLGRRGRCGQPVCGQPQCGCSCGTVAPVETYIPPASIPMALPMTSMVPEPVTTYKNVTRTMVRREAYRVNVPVTTYKQEVRYRDVPYQVSQRVAKTEMRYVPRTTYQPPARVGCNSCKRGYSVRPVLPMRQQTARIPALPSATPIKAGHAGLPTLAYPEPISAMTPAMQQNRMIPMPTADPSFAQAQTGQQWQTIRSRHSNSMTMQQQQVATSASQLDGYRTLRPGYGNEMPKTASRPAGKRFVAAPSAASVMRTQLR